MKKFLFFAAMLAGTSAIAQNWTLDKSHANLNFSVTHMMVSDVEGSFKKFDVKLTAAKEDFSDATVEVTIDPATVNTDNEGRDKHLRSADFFDVEKFPAMSFKSKTFKKVDEGKYVIVGDFTMHGVTKEVTLYATLRGPAVHPYNKKTVAGFKVTGSVKRLDFGVGTGSAEAMLGNEINFTANLEVSKD